MYLFIKSFFHEKLVFKDIKKHDFGNSAKLGHSSVDETPVCL